MTVSRSAPCPPRVGSPWPLVAGGLVAVVLAWLTVLFGGAADPPGALLGARIVLLLGGVLAVGVGVARRPGSAGVLAAAAVAARVAAWGTTPAWDSLGLVLAVASVVALAAAGLVLLTPTLRRLALSLLIVVHFAGILTAVTSVPPPGGTTPWLSNQLWTRFYRPYLQFMYLNNAYHFYSPDPGPACLLWVHLRYEDGSTRWVRFPDRAEHGRDPMALQYYRRLSVTESTNQLSLAGPSSVAVERRRLAGELLDIPAPDVLATYLPTVTLYRAPVDAARHVLQSYARHMARAYPHDDPAVPVAGVKIYRVVHAMVGAGDLAAGADPHDPTLYLPYYQGEYDAAGNLKDENDPFLYWLIPILHPDGTGAVRDYVETHARLTERRATP